MYAVIVFIHNIAAIQADVDSFSKIVLTNFCLPQIMKKVAAEFPLFLSHETPALSLFRFPCNANNLLLNEVKYKPLSGHVEFRAPFPQRNVSAIKLKVLNSEHFIYRSHPAPLENHYSVHVQDGKLCLRKIQKVYIFDPDHYYYEVAAQNSGMKKAESREELEHRKRNINYKLRNIENEEPRTLKFKDVSSKYPTILPINDASSCESQAEIELSSSLANLTVKPERSKIEDTVKHTRICNLQNLINIFGDETAIKNILFKMTVKVAGRFVLRNNYYEKELWEPRTKLLELFNEKNGRIPISEVLFLGEESWLADEIAKKVGQDYVLYGFEENSGFDIVALEASNKMAVMDVMKRHRMLNVEGVCAQVSLDQDIVLRFLSQPGYQCLANNAYALDDDSFWFNSVLKAYGSKKCMEMSEIRNILSAEEDTHSEEEVLSEIKHYCNQRGGKYYLKIMK